MGGEEVDFRFKISDLRLGQSGGAIACGGTVEDKTGNVKLRANHGPPFRRPLNAWGGGKRRIFDLVFPIYDWDCHARLRLARNDEDRERRRFTICGLGFRIGGRFNAIVGR